MPYSIGFLVTVVLWFFMAIIPPIIMLSSSSMLLMKTWFDLFLFFPLLFFIGLYIALMRVFNIAIRGFRFFDDWLIKYYVISGICGSLLGVYYYLRKVVYTADIAMLWERVVMNNFQAEPARSLVIFTLYILIAIYLITALSFQGTNMNKLLPRINFRAPMEKILSYYS